MEIAVLVGAEEALRAELVQALEAVGVQCAFVSDSDALVTAALISDVDLVLLDPTLRCAGTTPPLDLLRKLGIGAIIAGLDRASRTPPVHAAGFDATVVFPFEPTAMQALFSQAKARRAGDASISDCFDGIRSDLAVGFRLTLPASLAALDAAAASGSWAELQTLTHRMKGVAGTFGFAEFASRCAHIESQLRSGQTRALAGAMLHATAAVRAGLDQAPHTGGDLEHV